MHTVIRSIKERPVFFAGLVTALLFSIYVNLIHKPEPIPYPKGETVTLSGTITEKTLDENGKLSTFKVRGTYGFLCYVNRANMQPSTLPIGAKVKITGRIGHFSHATNPGEFDTFKYNETRGYLFYVNLSSAEILSYPRFPIKEYFFDLKTDFTKTVLLNCPREGATINTILFGDRSSMEDERRTLYKNAGLSHFLVISGLHISAAGGFIYMLIRKMNVKRRFAALAGMLFIIFYGLLAGFTVSVIRAVIMFLIRLLADMINRTYDILTALAVSSTVTLFMNPLYIRDPSYLYSYAAVLFIGLFYTLLKRDFDNEKERRLLDADGFKALTIRLYDHAFIPILIYFALLPLSLFFNSYSNLLSIPLNLILALFTGPILLTGFSGFLFGSLKLKGLAKIADFLCALLLRIIDGISSAGLKISIFRLIGKPGIILVLIYYLCFLFFLFLSGKKTGTGYGLVVMLTALTILTKPHYIYPSITMLDIGQGDCAVIQTGKHTAIISDCGSSTRSEAGRYVLVPFLLSRGITEISDIYISHGDADHINGIYYLIDNKEDLISADRVVFPGLPENLFNEDLKEIYRSSKEHGIDCVFINAGTVVKYDEISLTCLSPGLDHITGDANTDSVIFLLNHKKFDMLFSGDATKESEDALDLYPDCLISEDKKIDVYKCAHHGSRFSSSEAFLDKASPDITVISCGLNNRYGHPHEETLKRLTDTGSRVYRTDQNGAITIKLLPSGYEVSSFIKKTY
ncbi:MAG: DNA internalization-related competence protein ComEC/Rec2 [Lachnospiraceae bacterium]|nr:DNA internalization-related competence protein ComEC/Rec2 [Lachnospiraceae bacterium]